MSEEKISANCASCAKKTSIGGQALIEGIMMRGPHKTVMANRLPDGSVSIEPINSKSTESRPAFLKLPIIRGVVGFVDSMTVGYKALMLSAERSGMLDEEEEKKTADTASETLKEAEVAAPEAETEEQPESDAQSAPEPETDGETVQTADADVNEDADGNAEQVTPAKEKGESVLTAVIGVISMVLGVVLAVALFMYIPSLVFGKLNIITGYSIGAFRALIEGVIKIIIFVIYMALVSQMKEIKRVFMYHGAEHKTIFCYEKGLPLTVENVRLQRRFHPRCGTSFLILMLIVSILVYSLLSFIPFLTKYTAVWVAFKLIMLPVICGIGYELIKFCGRHDNTLTRIISAPGMWLQRISTKEPDDSMIEVAIAAMVEVIPENSEDDNW